MLCQNHKQSSISPNKHRSIVKTCPKTTIYPRLKCTNRQTFSGMEIKILKYNYGDNGASVNPYIRGLCLDLAVSARDKMIFGSFPRSPTRSNLFKTPRAPPVVSKYFGTRGCCGGGSGARRCRATFIGVTRKFHRSTLNFPATSRGGGQALQEGQKSLGPP